MCAHVLYTAKVFYFVSKSYNGITGVFFSYDIAYEITITKVVIAQKS